MNYGFLHRPHVLHKPWGVFVRRKYTTVTPIQNRSLIGRIVKGAAMVSLGTTVTIGLGGTILYKTNNQFCHVVDALERCSVAGVVGVKIALDYQRTLSKDYITNEAYEQAKKACHQRCAERTLVAVQRLGGVYVKLGQHVSVMQYLLPNEWCQTMRVLQDRCDPTSPEDIQQLFITDYGLPVEDIFEEFDWKPIGVASLAQVHRARLKDTSLHDWIMDEDSWVAVKIQHPNLDNYCQIDMDTVSFMFEIIKRIFPDFGFEWFAEEMRESIPKELDFVHETKNARKVEANFQTNHDTALVIPRVVWAKRRIMCMECMFLLLFFILFYLCKL